MTKTYSYAGVSTLAGVCKVRFANDALRVKVLAKNEHKDIDLVQLKVPMNKEDAIAFLFSINFANGNAIVQAAMEEAVEARAEKPAKVEAEKPAKPAKPAKVAKVAPTIEAIKAKVATAKAKTAAEVAADAALEDAPF